MPKSGAIDQIAMMSPLVNVILYTGLTGVLILGARLVDIGMLQTGTIIAFLSYFILITNSLLGLNRMFNIYNRAVASIERIKEVLNMPTDESQLIPENASMRLRQIHPFLKLNSRTFVSVTSASK